MTTKRLLRQTSATPSFYVKCCVCGKQMQSDKEQVWADLRGVPFQSYLCAMDAEVAYHRGEAELCEMIRELGEV